MQQNKEEYELIICQNFEIGAKRNKYLESKLSNEIVVKREEANQKLELLDL